MASEAKILEALFGPSIPTEKAAILPEIMAHIRAIDDLLMGKPRQRARPRISDPAISGPINHRIVELFAEIGKDWPKIAATICQEFNVRISPDACRGRHKDAVARQEAYAALSGSAIQAGQYTTPPEVAAKIDELQFHDMLMGKQDAPVDPVVDPKPGQQVAQRPDDQQIEAIKKEALKLYHGGQDVKAIAEKLGVRWQWVRSICARSAWPEKPAQQQTPRLVTMSAPQAPEPEPKPEPEMKVPLNPMDAHILEMVKQGAMVHEICIVINRNFNHNLSTGEMAEKIRTLQAGLQ